jgi:hypothetical protein
MERDLQRIKDGKEVTTEGILRGIYKRWKMDGKLQRMKDGKEATRD